MKNGSYFDRYFFEGDRMTGFSEGARGGKDMDNEREFPMSPRDFRRIQRIAYQLTGIQLSEHKQNMVYGRLSRRLRLLGLPDFADYCDLLNGGDPAELKEFTNAITTNLTAFFRERHHFDYLRTQLLPEVLRENASARRLRIWSAGCSTGEEAYSIAMVVRQLAGFASWDAKILATDLDSNVIAKGAKGKYGGDRAALIPPEYRQFALDDPAGGGFTLREDVRALVTFKQLNLLHPWPMKGPFDAIFCRNVVIYFDTATQIKLFDRYADLLRPGGHLFIGHSENLHRICDRFIGLGRTIYRLKG